MNRAQFDLWSTKEVARVLALVEVERDSYREMLAAVPAPIAVVSAARILTWANRSFLRLLGVRVDDLRGKDIGQVLGNAGMRFTSTPLGDGEETMLLVEHEGGSPSLPSRPPRAERMEALEAAAGRLAHDLNNPLMIITGYSEEVLESLGADHPARTEVAEILSAARRIASMGTRLTEFVRKNANPAVPIDVTKLLTGLEARIKQAAAVACSIDASGGPVWALADAGQLEQVILTLASQDLESARERTRLTLKCSTEGEHACISLRDDGKGLDAAKQAAVFETGLTAKTDSKEAQSGMALAGAYSLVRQWGGDIEFTSEPGRGSEYRINLRTPASQPVPESPAKPGRATILVVEDEAGIRGLVSKFLRREGFRVMEAVSAEEALKASKGQHVDLLVTDAMLPGIQGADLARKLYEADPRLKVLYISGYTPDESVRSGAFPPGAGFLAKPFTLAALLAKVRELRS